VNILAPFGSGPDRTLFLGRGKVFGEKEKSGDKNFLFRIRTIRDSALCVNRSRRCLKKLVDKANR